MKRVAHVLDVSSGFRHSFRRYRGFTSRPRPGKGGQKRGPWVEEHYPVAQSLKEVLSPEACGWLEDKASLTRGTPKAKGKGKEREESPVSRNLAPHPALPPSQEKQSFEAAQPMRDDWIMPDSEDGQMEETEHIPAGTLVELRRYASCSRRASSALEAHSHTTA